VAAPLGPFAHDVSMAAIALPRSITCVKKKKKNGRDHRRCADDLIIC